MRKVVFALCLILFSIGFAHAQDIFNGRDLRQVQVDQLSAADIARIQQQLQANRLTPEQAEQLAIQRGMPAAEAAKLKQRLGSAQSQPVYQNSQNNQDTADNFGRRNGDTTNRNAQAKPLIDPRIFGSELFNNSTFNASSNNQIATPVNYVVGPGDQLQISVFGIQEMNLTATVNPEGTVSIPNVGQIQVAGSTIESVTQRIRQTMGNTAYATLRSGGSRLSVNLGSRIRSIHVTVIGANKPGGMVVSSLATAFSVLQQAGGPGPFGSFRQIELVRAGQPVRKIDLYKFLVNGDQADNVRLQDNDVLRIPAYKKRVDLEGQVKRPGLFELLPSETFSDLISFASGFTDSAYRAAVSVTQLTATEVEVRDLPASEFSTYIPTSGDSINVSRILRRYANRVTIAGAVFRPGIFQLTPGIRAADLIRRADGLREDAYTSRGQIIRLRSDLTREVVSFDIAAALKGDPANNVLLQREDSLVITSVLDLRDPYKVSIQGEVRFPGIYVYAREMTIKDLIIQAGGFTEAAQPQRIEVSRLIRRDTLTAQDQRSSEVIALNNSGDLAVNSRNVTLQPNDIVTIRRNPGYTPQDMVTVSGQVQYPGPYVIQSRSERISDLLRLAGGLSPEANVQGAYLRRFITERERQLKEEKVKTIQEGLQTKDSSEKINTRVLGDISREYDQIPLDLQLIMNTPGSTEDLIIRNRDELYVPKFDAQVRISGSVLLPTQIPYHEEYHLRDYLSAAGGTASDAQRRKIYVLYANGKAATSRHFLFFKSYPRVKPGSEIVVPKRPVRRDNTGAIIGYAGVLASLAGVVIALLNITR